MYNSKILGTGIYTPEKILTNQDLEKMVDTNDQWIVERTGIKERRIADPKKGEFPTEMAMHAAKQAIKNANIEANDIDLILFATCTGDYPLPSSSTILQTKLEITNKCACLDIQAACSGFIYGFNMADSFIKTGMAKTILVIGAEMLSQEVDWTDRGTCILFGDGCGAAIIARNEDKNDPATVHSVNLGADGTGRYFFYKEYGGAAKRFTPEVLASTDFYMKMNGKEMFKVATRTLAENAKAVLDAAGKTAADVDWVVPHQANLRIIETCAKLLDFPMEKMIVNIHKYGNTSAATIPLAFHEAIEEGKIKRGQTVLFDAFGAGLTSGACLFTY